MWGSVCHHVEREASRFHPIYALALVFGTGFVLGTVRVLLVAPRVGTRTAELLEMPVMILASVLAARWTTGRFATGAGAWERLGIGLVALALLLAAEVVLGMALRGASPRESLVNPDPIAGTGYYLALAVFAILPWLLGRRRGSAMKVQANAEPPLPPLRPAEVVK